MEGQQPTSAWRLEWFCFNNGGKNTESWIRKCQWVWNNFGSVQHGCLWLEVLFDSSALLRKCQPCRINVCFYAQNKLFFTFLLEC